MQELFLLTADFKAELNKPWIALIPEFNAVLKADRGSKGDSEGRNKAQARKIFVYMYFMINFKSPIHEWEEGERHEEAMRYADVTEKDVATPTVRAAVKKYEEIQRKAARSIRSLEAADKGMVAFDEYMNNIDFKQVDKMGKLLHSPKEFVENMSRLNKAYDELDKFRKRVHEELKESSTIRGQASLGDKESKADLTRVWEEAGPEQKDGDRLLSDISAFVSQSKTEGDEDTEEEQIEE